MDPHLPSIADCLHRHRELRDSDTARLDLELLLARVLDQSRSYLYTWPERTLNQNQLERFETLLARRKAGEPVAHLLGEKEFWSLTLQVNDSTLIPRPETERLVETALELLGTEPRHVLDLGTGTGAIALALASERPAWRILAVDESPAAVQLAIENCRRLGFRNVEVTRSHWFGNVGPEAFDLIVANPPYIAEDDPHLKEGDLRFEPASVLVARDKGLGDIRHIVSDARQHLYSGGWLLIEHGFEQGEAVRQLFTAAGYAQVETRQDLAGRDRLTLGRIGQEAT